MTTNPLPRRRAGRIVQLSAVATLLAIGCAACGSDDSSDDSSDASSGGASDAAGTTSTAIPAIPASPATGPTTGQQRATILDYTSRNQGVGVELTSPVDVSKLTGAPADFRTFIAGVVAQANQDAGNATCASGASVAQIRVDDFAVGGVNSCGGYAALWAKVDGRWQEVDGTQDTWDCDTLERFSPPASMVGHQCFSYHGDHKAHRYPSTAS